MENRSESQETIARLIKLGLLRSFYNRKLISRAQFEKMMELQRKG